MVLGLRELGLPVVAVGVGPLCVDAGAGKRSVKRRAANDPLVFAITEMAPPSSSSSKEDVQKYEYVTFITSFRSDKLKVDRNIQWTARVDRNTKLKVDSNK